jgi:hypothetical protein
MAKLIGSLVGAPVQNLQASGYGLVPNLFKDGSDQILVRDVVQFNNNVIGDVISLGVFKSTAYLDYAGSNVFFDAVGAGVTLNIGDAAHASALNSAMSLAAQGQLPLAKAKAVQMGFPLWQRLNWASDPGGTIELLATIGGAAPTNGMNFAWQIVGRNI